MRKLLSLVALMLATPAGAADRPWAKLSFSLPAGNPTFNAFDPAPLNYNSHSHDIRFGHPNGAAVPSVTRSSSAFLTPQPGARSMGARLRVQTWDFLNEQQTPWALDLSWIREQRTVVQVFGSESVSVGTYRDRCLPHWESWCVDFGDRSRNSYTGDYRGHDLTLHVFRAGLNYDLLYGTKRFSLEPGIGLEWSVARQRTAIEGTRCAGGRCEQVPRVERTNWPNSNDQTGYVSLSGDVYPLGKRRFIGLGASTRYLLASGDWVIRSGTVLGNYEIPIQSHRWSTSFHATLAF